MFDPRRIVAETFVRRVEVHERLASTNDRALDLAREGGEPWPALVVARQQTRGRGRNARVWWSATGSLTFSLVVDCGRMKLSSAPPLSPATAVAMANALASFAPAVCWQLKWPNDVYAEGLKACGILLESPAVPAGLVVAGIGVNVSNSFRDAPPELRRRATSLLDLTGRAIPLEDVLIASLQQLGEVLPEAVEGRWDLVAAWQPRCLLSGRQVRIAVGSAAVEGVCRGVDRRGGLILETPHGRRTLSSGSVAWWEGEGESG